MQHRTDTRHEAGTICLASGNQPRYYEFTSSMDALAVPAGTIFNVRRSCDVAYNFNRATRDMKGAWAWYLGDDHQFKPNTLLKMLDYNVDVVVPISPCKTAPFAPCVIHGPKDGSVWRDDMLLYEWRELSADGLMELPKGDFIGQAGMLVRRHVLDAIGDPWFKTGKFDELQEDLWFCHELQERGFKIMVDCTTIFDHWFTMGVSARKHEGRWVPALKSGAATMVLPDAMPMYSADQNTGVGPGNVTWMPVPGREKAA